VFHGVNELIVFPGFSSGNSLAFGRYVLFASGSDAPDGWQARGIIIPLPVYSPLAKKLECRHCDSMHLVRVFVARHLAALGNE
jgi:hypothetical protein